MKDRLNITFHSMSEENARKLLPCIHTIPKTNSAYSEYEYRNYFPTEPIKGLNNGNARKTSLKARV